jgi:hypothetical protein
MHSIEKFAQELKDLANDLAVCSSKYVALANMLRNGVADNTEILCTICSEPPVNITLKIGDLSNTIKNEKMMVEIEQQAHDLTPVIGTLWSRVSRLAETMTNGIRALDQDADEAKEKQVFKVEDDG